MNNGNRMEKILITGAAGNIGSALLRRLLADDRFVITAVDNLSTGSLDKLPETNERWSFIRCDCNDHDDLATVMCATKFDYVFHYAAVVGVQRTQENPMSVFRDIEGLRNILNLSKNTGVKRIFFSSSSEVYGEPCEFPQHEETTPLNSRIPYAVVKNLGEIMCRTYSKEFGLDYTIFRFFNTFGPNQSKDFVIPKFVMKAMRGEDIELYGDGLQTRTFCFVDDNTETCVRALKSDFTINSVLNVGGAVEYTIKEIAELVIRIVGSDSKIVHVDALKEGDMRRRRADNSKMLQLLGRDLIPLEDGIRRLVRHLQNNE
jgi:UDP-glucuronate decarboxylase